MYECWQENGCRDAFLRHQIDTIHMSNISTIHSFCGIIHKFGFELNISPEFTVSGFKYQVDKITSEVIKEKYYGKSFVFLPTYKVQEIIKNFINQS